MNTSELLALVNAEPLLKRHCLGVVPADFLPWRIDPGFGIIANTADSSSDGEHWSTIYNSPLGQLEYFCSYGNKMSAYHSGWVDFAARHCDKVLYNPYRIQEFGSNVCGLYAVFFLLFRIRNWSYEEIVCNLLNKTPSVNDTFIECYVQNFFEIDVLRNIPLRGQKCKPFNPLINL